MKAVLFDLDGVLLNSEPVNVAAAVHAFKDSGIYLSAEDKKQIVGRHPADYNKIFRKYVFDKKKIVKLHAKYYAFFYHRARPYPYARSLVLLAKKNCKTALVTSSERYVVNKALRVLKLFKSDFDAFVTFESCKERKPSPLPYLIAAKTLKVKPKDCLVVEDSVPGVTSAKRAKIKCFAVTHTTPASKLKKADLIVKSLNDSRITNLLSSQ